MLHTLGSRRVTRILLFAETTNGLAASLNGAMGAITSASTRGSMMDEPTLIAYDVEPVGVATINPSALTCIARVSLTDMLKWRILAMCAVWMTTSLVASGSLLPFMRVLS